LDDAKKPREAETVQPRIRPFGERDLGAVVRLSLRAWEPVFASIERAMGAGIFARLHPDWREDQKRAVEEVCASRKKRVWVAEAGESAVVGFVAVELHTEKNFGEIYMLAVDPDHQNCGVGTALTGFALERIKESGMAVAMVETGGDPGHAPARRTYEKAGYVRLPIARYFKEL
jgi:ribosomal protein S18 acetylase RimI-like enzyme